MKKHRKANDYNSDAPPGQTTDRFHECGRGRAPMPNERIPVRTRDILARQRQQGAKR